MSKTTEEKSSYSQVRKSIEQNDPRRISLNFSKMVLSEKELHKLHGLLKNNTQVLRITWSTQQIFPESLHEEMGAYLKRNNDKFQVWPTDFELALLSSHVYGSVSEGSKIEGIPNSSEEFTHLKNWSVYEVFEDEVSGYFGVLYKRDHQWVLAHRGTDSNLSSSEGIQDMIKNTQETLKDVQTDIDSIVKIKITRQQSKGYEATLKAQEYVNRLGGSLSITGHSLGGWLAQLSAFYIHHQRYNKNHLFKMVPHTVVFDAPSAREMINKLYQKPNLEALLHTFDMKLYLSAPNPFNCCGGLPIAKETIRLYPDVNVLPIHPYLVYAGEKLKNMENWKEKLFNLMGKNAISEYCKKMVDSVTDIPNDLLTDLKVLNTHLLAPLITTFDKETGQPHPSKHKIVVEWPSIHFKNTQKKKVIGSLWEKALTGLGVPDLLKPAIQASIDDLPINHMAGILVDWLTGEIDHVAYREFYQYTNETKGYEVNVESLTNKERFRLLYQAHYDTIKPETKKIYVRNLPSVKEVYIPDFLKGLQALSNNDPYLTHIAEFKRLKEQYVLEKDSLIGERYFKEIKGEVSQFYTQVYRTIHLYPFSAKQLSEDAPFEPAQLLKNDVEILPEQPLTAEILLKKGDLSLEENDVKEALEAYSQAIELDAKCAEAYLKRARISHSLNNESCEEIKQDLKIWIQLELETSKNSSIQTVIGYLEENAFKTYVLWVSQYIAEEAFKEAELNLKQGRYEKAIQSYDQVIRLTPEFAKAYLQRGMVRELLCQKTLKDISCKHNELTQSYNETHSVDLEFESFCENWKQLQESAQLQKAIEDYTYAIQLNSKFAEGYYRRAKARYILNRFELNEEITQDLKDFAKFSKLETSSFQKLLKERGFNSQVDQQFKIILHKTFLSYVVEEDDDVLLKKMYAQGFPLDLTNEKGENVCLMAAASGSKKILVYCQKNERLKGLLTEKNDEGNGIFHLAAQNNQTQLISVLKTLRVDINQKNKLGQTVVHLCAFHGQSDFLKLLEELKPELQEEAKVILKKETFYFTPIQVAVAMGHQTMVELLFKYHVNCQKLHKDLGSLLHIAIHFNQVNLFDVLVNKLTISPDLPNSKGLNALAYAAWRDEVSFIKVLIKHIKDKGGDINTPDEFGRLALHYAAIKLNVRAVKYLAEIGMILFIDKEGNNPWQLAENTVDEMKDGYEKTLARFKLNRIHNLFFDGKPFTLGIEDISNEAKELVQGRKVSLPEYLSRSFFKENKAYKKVLEGFSETFSFQALLNKLINAEAILRTSLVKEFLFYVAEIGDLEELKTIYAKAFSLNLEGENINENIEEGKFLEINDQDSMRAFHLAAKKGQTHLISTFRSLGVDMKGKNTSGQTVVHLCALHGKFHFLLGLVQQGLRLNLEEKAEITIGNEQFRFNPVQIAVATGNQDVVNLLKSQGVYFQIKHEKLGGLLHLAIRFKQQKIFDNLLNKWKLDPSETNGDRLTVFSYAVSFDDPLNNGDSNRYFFVETLVRHIKQHGKNINQQDEFGRTALHYTAGQFRDELVEFLVKNGMISSVIDYQKKNPWGYTQDRIQEIEKKRPLKPKELLSIKKIKLLLSDQAFQILKIQTQDQSLIDHLMKDEEKFKEGSNKQIKNSSQFKLQEEFLPIKEEIKPSFIRIIADIIQTDEFFFASLIAAAGLKIYLNKKRAGQPFIPAIQNGVVWGMSVYGFLRILSSLSSLLQQKFGINGHVIGDEMKPTLLSILKKNDYPTQNQTEPLFDRGTWGTPELDLETGVLRFPYRVLKDDQEVGSAIFYNHPLLCRSERGDRHNVISFQGVLAKSGIEEALKDPENLAKIEDICELLPPTWLERLTSAALSAIPHGIFRGMAKVSTYALQMKNASQWMIQGAYYMTYYGSLFLWQYSQYYLTLPQEMPEIQKILTAAYQAAWGLGILIITNLMIHQVCRFLSWLSQQFKGYEWHQTAKFFQCLSDYGPYGCYGYQGYIDGWKNTVVKLLTGALVETIIKEIGKYGVDRYLKTPTKEPTFSSEISLSVEPKLTLVSHLCSKLGFFGLTTLKESEQENRKTLKLT